MEDTENKKLRRMNLLVATVLFIIAMLASVTPFYYLAGAGIAG